MRAQIKNQSEVYLGVPHLNREITFVYPAKGPDTYLELATQLEQNNLSRPTMSQNSSLIHSVRQNPKERYSKEIMSTLKNSGLCCFNKILYLPNKGAYIQDNPEIKDIRIVKKKSDLFNKLDANDPSVRFVPFGYKIGIQSAKALEENAFVIGLAGEEGAQKLAEVSRSYKSDLCLSSLDNTDEKLISVAVVPVHDMAL